MNPGIVVDVVERLLAIHPLIEYNRKALLALIESTHYPEHIVDNLAEQLGIMSISFVSSIKQR